MSDIFMIFGIGVFLGMFLGAGLAWSVTGYFVNQKPNSKENN